MTEATRPSASKPPVVAKVPAPSGPNATAPANGRAKRARNASDYDAASIQVLEGLEAVRRNKKDRYTFECRRRKH